MALKFLYSQYCDYYPDYEGCKKWLQKNLPNKFADLQIGGGGGGGPAAAATADGEPGAEDGDDQVSCSIFVTVSSFSGRMCLFSFKLF